MKNFNVLVSIKAENYDDLLERLEDADNPIDDYVQGSIEETD